MKIFGNINFHQNSMQACHSRVFIALRPIGFRPLDHLVTGYRTFDFQLITHHITPNEKLAGIGI